MESSSMNIGLYPSAKIGKNAVHSVCSAEDYDLLVTDTGIAEDFLQQAKEKGIAIELADLH